MEISKWKEDILEKRNHKDIFFSSHYQSPIPFEQRQQFKRLDYYPPDPDFRFELELHEHEEKKILKINDTKGSERAFLRWGEFKFKIGDTECTLQAYKNDPHEKRLFVPFRDETSGGETYGAGRYLDLDDEHHHTTDGKWILDFNSAYNPWCAYSAAYACPFVDPENWLKAAVRAGEKKYSLKNLKNF
jgi:uncharacterized protein (DUF1684 family)